MRCYGNVGHAEKFVDMQNILWLALLLKLTLSDRASTFSQPDDDNVHISREWGHAIPSRGVRGRSTNSDRSRGNKREKSLSISESKFAPVLIRNDLKHELRPTATRAPSSSDKVSKTIADLFSVGIFATAMAFSTAIAAASGDMQFLD